MFRPCSERLWYENALAFVGEAWNAAFEHTGGVGTVVSPATLAAERKKTRALGKELHRKGKALAEVAALLTLSRRAQAIWGTDEDA